MGNCAMTETLPLPKEVRPANPEVLNALLRLEKWMVENKFAAYDPFDGLDSPLAPFLTLGSTWLRMAWQQTVRRFPFNLRPWLGIKKAVSSKAMGFFAQGYLRLHQTTGQEEYLDRMKFCLNWLLEHPTEGYSGYCWGNHFRVQSRGGYVPRYFPTIVWSGLIAHAFLDAYEFLGESRYAETAASVCKFIIKDLGWVERPEGICLRYYPKTDNLIHNSSLLGAALLARAGLIVGDKSYGEVADRAMQFTVHHQRVDGAWYYGVEDKYRWVDSFHTGYNLEAIDTFERCCGSGRYRSSLSKGYQFYLNTFFGPDGTPRYYEQKTNPLDIQCASHGIQALVNLRALNPRSLGMARKVARWTMANMQDPSGYFYYRKYARLTNKTPTLHWAQATMFASLALLHQCESCNGAKPAGRMEKQHA